MRVLVVDDVEINRKLLSATLEAEGVEIVLAEDGQEALSVLETEGVDAIISDILMPNVDGYRLCYEIRKNDALKNIPFIVYSESYTSPSDEKLAAQFGADRFLKKSASTREILTALNEVTNGGRFRVSSSGPPLPDLDVMKEYSERLVSMLKEKNTELERAKQMLVSTNRELLKRTFELKESEERYREIFENSAEGIIQSLPSGRILTANPAAARILGYESPRHLIENLRGIQDHYADPQRGLDSTRPANWDEAMEPSELELNRIDGKRIWVLARGRQVRDADGAVICYESTIEDITGRKHLEDQLRQSQKMEAIGRLAGGVAHDFNNLLTAIIGYAQLASGRVDCPDPVNKDIQEIEKAGRRAAALTNQLLIFSRRQVIQAKVMDLNSVVTDAENMLTRLIGEDIELVTSLDPAVRPIKADPTQVEQIILNLAINARDAMPDGGKLIIETQNVVLDESYLSQHMEAARGAYVMLAVSDTGHGMDQDTQSHIFEPFFTTKEMGKGTGLGLSTVYGIVKQAGGHVDLSSEPGAGATFRIYIPSFNGAIEAPAAKSSTDSCRGSETVLLVEDDAAVRSLARLILETNGYTVIDACNADEALSIFSQIASPVDLLITDVVMPGSSGPKLAEALRVSHANLKVLYISGYTDKALPFGELTSKEGFLQKPFTPASLSRTIRDVLDART